MGRLFRNWRRSAKSWDFHVSVALGITNEENLESIADSFKGVSKAFALQAGREIRIMVESEQVSDEEAVWLSKDIAKRVENELQYPGQIKVTVVRETRAIDYAR